MRPGFIDGGRGRPVIQQSTIGRRLAQPGVRQAASAPLRYPRRPSISPRLGRPQAQGRHLTAAPRFVPQTAKAYVGNPQARSSTAQSAVTAFRRQVLTRRTPGRVPSGRLISLTNDPGHFYTIARASRATVTGIVALPPQPFVPVIAARLKKGQGR
jgi:hypothetical protein